MSPQQCLLLPELTKYGIDEFRRDNLLKLANWDLDHQDIEDFTMELYCSDIAGECVSLDEIWPCGAVGCMVGHGPAAGITPDLQACGNNWFRYSSTYFIDADYSYNFSRAAWDWCFSADWRLVDNTIRGASLRILWLLRRGLPSNWDDQLCGTTAICYETQEISMTDTQRNLPREELINIADAAHSDDGMIRTYFENPHADCGDTLAQFVARELESLHDACGRQATDSCGGRLLGRAKKIRDCYRRGR